MKKSELKQIIRECLLNEKLLNEWSRSKGKCNRCDKKSPELRDIPAIMGSGHYIICKECFDDLNKSRDKKLNWGSMKKV